MMMNSFDFGYNIEYLNYVQSTGKYYHTDFHSAFSHNKKF